MNKSCCHHSRCVFVSAAVWLLIVAGICSSRVAAAEPVELNVMSFNIRYSYGGLDEQATENNWTDSKFPRRDRVIHVIRAYSPDLLGVQEARHLQIKDLEAALPEFEFYGIGRDDGKTGGEYSGIFYSKDRFTRPLRTVHSDAGGPDLRLALAASRAGGGLWLRGLAAEVRERLRGGVDQGDEPRPLRSCLISDRKGRSGERPFFVLECRDADTRDPPRTRRRV